jgi:SAM-dependent methyltransferase
MTTAQERIDAFPVWHYEFDFDTAKTPIFRPDWPNRHQERRRMGFDPLVQALGGSLRGRSVLDLGSNAGFWSLAAIEAGADFVLGIDGRQMHIDQANLVFELKQIDPSRYRFELGNIFEHIVEGQFDVVFAVGLMYHIAKPVELFELIARVAPKLVWIDTLVNLIPGGAFRVAFEDVENPRNALDHEMVLIPSRQAVIDLGSEFGFETVPLAQHILDPTGMSDYAASERAMFLSSRGISLDAVEREPMDSLTLGRAFARKSANRARRRISRLRN